MRFAAVFLVVCAAAAFAAGCRVVKEAPRVKEPVLRVTPEELFFDYQYKPQSYERFSGAISTDTSEGMTFVQQGGVRLYFATKPSLFQEMVFRSGLVHYKYLYTLPDKVGETEYMKGWKGHTIMIVQVEELAFLPHLPTQRRCRIRAYPKGYFIGTDNFLIEFTNPGGTATMPIEEFMQKAEMTFCKWASMDKK